MKSSLTAVVAAVTCAVVAFTPTVAAAAPGASAGTSGHLKILMLGNRADLISGGDALVEVLLPPGADASRLRVVLATDQGPRNVSEAFARRAVKGEWEANGRDTFARRRGGVTPETPVREVEGKK